DSTRLRASGLGTFRDVAAPLPRGLKGPAHELLGLGPGEQPPQSDTYVPRFQDRLHDAGDGEERPEDRLGAGHPEAPGHQSGPPSAPGRCGSLAPPDWMSARAPRWSRGHPTSSNQPSARSGRSDRRTARVRRPSTATSTSRAAEVPLVVETRRESTGVTRTTT